MTGSLFDPSPDFDRTRLADNLERLARDRIYIGTSSWKYEGWLDQVYTRSNYSTKGRFSKRAFEAECLREYATVFPTVCGDFSFYQFPTAEFWRSLFEKVPPGFRFALKVPEQITCKVFPDHERYGPQAGEANSGFLDVELLREAFLHPLEPYRDRICALIFEFGTFSKRSFSNLERFLEKLDPFLEELPSDFRYAAEIRNPEFLDAPYLDCLKNHRVAHVFNSWTRMPPLRAQLRIPEAMTTDFVVVRGLLRFGRPYEQAVEMFSPYDRVRDPNPEIRETLRDMIDRMRKARREAYIYVNNRLEGNAPATIEAIV